MRQIKFRAWDKINKDMNYHYRLDFEDKNIEWMQFTGLLDKNSKEIYEGDIMSGNILVKWEEDICKEYGCVGWSIGVGGYGMTSSKELEIIGNIYDNPELTK
jgi:hypothetical protein